MPKKRLPYGHLVALAIMSLAGMLISLAMAQQPDAAHPPAAQSDQPAPAPAQAPGPGYPPGPGPLGPVPGDPYTDCSAKGCGYYGNAYGGPWLRSALSIQNRWGYAYRPEFGVVVRGGFFPQVANGLAAQMVLRLYDFNEGQLNEAGLRRAFRMTETLKRHGMPIVVESSGDELLDQTRKDNVVDAIQKLANAPIAPEAVVVSQQFPSGFGGEESRQVYFTLMQQVQNGGVTYQNGRSITGIGATPGGGSNTGQGTQSVLGNSNGR